MLVTRQSEYWFYLMSKKIIPGLGRSCTWKLTSLTIHSWLGRIVHVANGSICRDTLALCVMVALAVCVCVLKALNKLFPGKARDPGLLSAECWGRNYTHLCKTHILKSTDCSWVVCIQLTSTRFSLSFYPEEKERQTNTRTSREKREKEERSAGW